MAEGMCPLVSFTTITRFRGIISCLLISVAYVASLYVFKSPYPRDHPKTIKQRFRSVFIVSLLSPFYVWLWSDGTLGQNALSLWQFLGIRLESIIIAVLFPLLLTVILFTGPIVLLYINKELTNVKSFIEYPSCWVNAISLRNYLVAPLSEEFVFRACLIPMLVPGFGNVLPIFICPLFFGVAHIHHVIERLQLGENPQDVWFNAYSMLSCVYSLINLRRHKNVVRTSVTDLPSSWCATFLFLPHFDVVYDLLKGRMSTWNLFVKLIQYDSGHLIGPVICHTFCNFMGFPVIDQIPSSKYPRFISASFLAGLVLFLVLALPLTNPTWYNSIYYQQQLVR